MAALTSFDALPQELNPNTSRTTVPWDSVAITLERAARTGFQRKTTFQRDVWPEYIQRRYVESRLLGNPAGSVIAINRGEYGWASVESKRIALGSPPPGVAVTWEGYAHYMLVDGNRRLHAVERFLNDELEVFGGVRFSMFTDRLPSHAVFQMEYGGMSSFAEILKWFLALHEGIDEAALAPIRHKLYLMTRGKE